MAGSAATDARAAAGPVRLAAHGLRKSFGSVVVTDDVSFVARGGEALGIIGPNGAGKTTLFHLLAGSLPAGLLSYAEQRALEIGITLAGGAEIILLDEPTAGMSHSETEAAVAL
ncbi:MAG TPA: ATP-binding cassette domain-containing protein, partial [Kofleriaceae bacterium]